MILKLKMQAGIRIVRVPSDGGKEYEKLERLEDLATHSAPYTPENNPISERGNSTLVAPQGRC
jgi:hypothetical protein